MTEHPVLPTRRLFLHALLKCGRSFWTLVDLISPHRPSLGLIGVDWASGRLVPAAAEFAWSAFCEA
jgi:hypothetical protein